MAQKAIKALKNYVGGKWIEANTVKTEAVVNPATGEVLAYVPLSSLEDINHAIETAAEAFETWKEIPVPKRARILFKYQQLLVENHNDLAKLITLENGKKLSRSIRRGAERN